MDIKTSLLDIFMSKLYFFIMRTTVRLKDSLLKQAKKFAVENGTTLTGLIEESLKARMAKKPLKKPFVVPKLTTFKGNGLRPGVDLDDSASLLDIMEGRK